MEKKKLAVIELPVEQLHSHPQNPRKELGDLSELADSIKEIGIQQNLTVIPYVDEKGNEVDDHFTVIMGHRRLAAAKQAGLATVPLLHPLGDGTGRADSFNAVREYAAQ